MTTGLFLGAGASFEVGMPLVWDLTAELKAWLTPEKLRLLNRGWRAQYGGYSDEVIEKLASVLVLPDLHYESILGFLETQFRRPSSRWSDQYHGLYVWLVEVIYWILYYRHIKNVTYIERNLPLLDGISVLAERHRPLWIFSLNHDLIIECLATRNSLPISSGFTSETVSLPRRNGSGDIIGDLRAEVITGEDFTKGAMQFFKPGKRGINLLKIHGALDVFTFREGADLLKILPSFDTPAGVIEALKTANEELIFVDPRAPNGRARIINEIAYADDTGEMQFLRRSLLAGSFKFDNRASQVLPRQMLDHFKANINWVSELICIGYGFGDVHINAVIRNWLEFASDRRIEIVSPGAKHIPSFLLHVAPQVKLTAATASDYLDEAGGITRNPRELMEKRFAAWVRSKGINSDAKDKFLGFVEQLQKDRSAQFVEKMRSLPWRDGDVDLQALGMTKEELVKQWSGERQITVEALIEAFLETQRAGT